MNNNKYAPVVIPTLNRFEHFRRCIESLRNCTNAIKTDLIIALDYPLKKSHEEGYLSIKSYIDFIDGFKSVNVILREQNFGAEKNLFEAIDFVLEKYDRLIISEDDNEFSPNFIEFVNWGLNNYEKNDKILSVCGYSYPIDIHSYPHQIYYAKEFSAWGCGIWKEKWNYLLVNTLVESYSRKILKSYFPPFKFSKIRLKSILGLINCYKSKKLIADVHITSYLHLNDLYCVFPKISKVRNWGHDGTGVNCGKIKTDKTFNMQIIDNSNSFFNEEIVQLSSYKIIKKTIDKYKSMTFKDRVYTFLLLISLKLKLKI